MLRGIGFDADGDSLITAWSELGYPLNTDGQLNTVPTSGGVPTQLDKLTPPRKPVLTIDGAFTENASFEVPEVGNNPVTPPGEGGTLNIPIAFTVIDSLGAYRTHLAIVVIMNDDDAPKANAGPAQQVAPGDFVRMNAVGSSDSDGDSLVYRWTYVGATVDPLPNQRAPLSDDEYEALDGWLVTDVSDDDDPNWVYIVGSDGKLFTTETAPRADDGSTTIHDDYDGLDYAVVSGTDLSGEMTAYPYFDAPVSDFNSITLTFEVTVYDVDPTSANVDGSDQDSAQVSITIANDYYSGQVTGPNFCLTQSLGGPQTFPFDSDRDGVADTCSLSTSRRATVARQNALTTLAVINSGDFAAAVKSECAKVKNQDFGDSKAALKADACETGRVSGPPAPHDPATAGVYFSGNISGPNFCANRSLGGPRTYAFDSDGDGVADVCSLPFTKREAVARQRALESLDVGDDPGTEDVVENAQYINALKAACTALGSTDFGDSAAAIQGDECSESPTASRRGSGLQAPYVDSNG